MESNPFRQTRGGQVESGAHYDDRCMESRPFRQTRSGQVMSGNHYVDRCMEPGPFRPGVVRLGGGLVRVTGVWNRARFDKPGAVRLNAS